MGVLIDDDEGRFPFVGLHAEWLSSIRLGIVEIEARLTSWLAMADRLGGVHEATLPLLFVRRWPEPFFRRWLFLILDESGWVEAEGTADGDVFVFVDWLDVFVELTGGCWLEARWWKEERQRKKRQRNRRHVLREIGIARWLCNVDLLPSIQKGWLTREKEKKRYHATEKLSIEFFKWLFKNAWLIGSAS